MTLLFIAAGSRKNSNFPEEKTAYYKIKLQQQPEELKNTGSKPKILPNAVSENRVGKQFKTKKTNGNKK